MSKLDRNKSFVNNQFVKGVGVFNPIEINLPTKFNIPGQDYTTTCDCTDGLCTPQGTSEDACTAICGNTTCP